jgi:hypothetical protein
LGDIRATSKQQYNMKHGILHFAKNENFKKFNMDNLISWKATEHKSSCIRKGDKASLKSSGNLNENDEIKLNGSGPLRCPFNGKLNGKIAVPSVITLVEGTTPTKQILPLPRDLCMDLNNGDLNGNNNCTGYFHETNNMSGCLINVNSNGYKHHNEQQIGRSDCESTELEYIQIVQKDPDLDNNLDTESHDVKNQESQTINFLKRYKTPRCVSLATLVVSVAHILLAIVMIFSHIGLSTFTSTLTLGQLGSTVGVPAVIVGLIGLACYWKNYDLLVLSISFLVFSVICVTLVISSLALIILDMKVTSNLEPDVSEGFKDATNKSLIVIGCLEILISVTSAILACLGMHGRCRS